MKNYKSKDNRIIAKNSKIISKLKKVNICLFILNFLFIRFNFLSPKDLKIFYYKNNLQKNESSEQAKIINDNNSNFNIINIKEAIENKNLIKNKNKILAKIYICIYGFLGCIIMMHLTHFIFCPNVSNKYNNFLVCNLPIYIFYTCII